VIDEFCPTRWGANAPFATKAGQRYYVKLAASLLFKKWRIFVDRETRQFCSVLYGWSKQYS